MTVVLANINITIQKKECLWNEKRLMIVNCEIKSDIPLIPTWDIGNIQAEEVHQYTINNINITREGIKFSD